MVKIRKYANGIERFLHGAKGQRFFNFAYSIGAAIVIWGALFKILHLPGGSTLLCIGMGTEIAMFILTAFDRPPKEYAWEDVFPVLDTHNAEDRPEFKGGSGGGVVGGFQGGIVGGFSPEGADGADGTYAPIEGEDGAEAAHVAGGGTFYGGGVVGGGGTVIIGGGGGSGEGIVFAEGEETAEGGAMAPTIIGGAPAVVGGGISTAAAVQAVGLPENVRLSEEDSEALREAVQRMVDASDRITEMAELTTATHEYLEQMAGIAEQMAQLRETTTQLNEVSSVILESYKAITENSENISQSSAGYVSQMADLNRNIGGLNTIYEIQLKSISSQLESIDRVNRGLKDIRDMYEKSAHESSRYCEETEKMARYMKQLNSVYEKMITAMTINMQNPLMGGTQTPVNPFADTEGKEA